MFFFFAKYATNHSDPNRDLKGLSLYCLTWFICGQPGVRLWEQDYKISRRIPDFCCFYVLFSSQLKKKRYEETQSYKSAVSLLTGSNGWTWCWSDVAKNKSSDFWNCKYSKQIGTKKCTPHAGCHTGRIKCHLINADKAKGLSKTWVWRCRSLFVNHSALSKNLPVMCLISRFFCWDVTIRVMWVIYHWGIYIKYSDTHDNEVWTRWNLGWWKDCQTFTTWKLPTTHSSSQSNCSVTFEQMSLHQVDLTPAVASSLLHSSVDFMCCWVVLHLRLDWYTVFFNRWICCRTHFLSAMILYCFC